ncbi:MAG: ParB/RepB/Spo0J family partition protein [Acidobacteriota bacterium]
MSKLRGLPQGKKSRTELHFVEELLSSKSTAIGKFIDICKLDVNPFQPRKDFGDLNELVSSIKEKGVLEPVLVRSFKGKYEIIAGERRYQASKIAGLKQIPCIEIDVDDGGSLEISLVENLQRKNLDPFEEATALQNLINYFDYTHEQIAKKLAKSRTSITETLSLNKLSEDIKDLCRRADIRSKSMLLQIARLSNEEDMKLLIKKIANDGMTREEARSFKREKNNNRINNNMAKRFIFHYRPENRSFSLNIRFNKQQVQREELISILEEIIERIKSDPSCKIW